MTTPLNIASNFSLPSSILERHVVVLGASGSGKTVFCKNIVEEAIRSGVPVIAIDLQGDITAMALVGDSRSDAAIASDYFGKLDIKVWTPGNSRGIPLSLVPRLYMGDEVDREDTDSREEMWDEVAAIIGSLIGPKFCSKRHVATFSRCLEYIWVYDLEIETLDDFADLLADPPMVLAESIDPFLTAKERIAVAKEIRVTVGAPEGRVLRRGCPLDIDTLLGLDGKVPAGKTRLSVIYAKNLDDNQKAQLVASVSGALYRWAMTQSGTGPKALFYLDEAAPFMPPSNVKRPVSKAPLMNLLRQGRKYGVGCLIATQSPGDMDYAALGQIGTWAIGRLPMVQQLDKVFPALRSSGADAEAVMDKVPGLTPGDFVVTCPAEMTGLAKIRPRWLSTKHEVLDDDCIKTLVTDADRAIYAAA